MVLFNKLLLCMQLLHPGLIWKIRVEIKLRERCYGWAETCNDLEQLAERGVKQGIGKGRRHGLGKGSFSGVGLWASPVAFHSDGGNARQAHQGGKALGLFHFPQFFVPVLMPWASYKVHAPYHNSQQHIFSAPLQQKHFPQPETLLRLASKPSQQQACPSTLALPQALVLSLQASPCRRSQLTIARTIRIFRGIMTGLVKHSCPWKSLIFLAAAQSVPRRAEVWQSPFSPAWLCRLMLAHMALLLCPVTAPVPVPSRDTASGRCGTALSSLQAPS